MRISSADGRILQRQFRVRLSAPRVSPSVSALVALAAPGQFYDVRKTLKPHPVAALFPEMRAADFEALKHDIRLYGVRVPILVHRGQILDGRHRYRACQELGTSCPTIQWSGEDPWLEVQSRNLVRRHLAKDQIYAIRKVAAERFPELAAPIQAAKMEAKRRQARKPQLKGLPANEKSLLRSRDRNKESADLIGAQLGVSAATVKRVDRLAREAPEFLPKVATGEISAMKALRQVALKRHGLLPSTADADVPTVELVVRHLRQTIRANWSRCPAEHRGRFLDELRRVLLQLAEHAAASDPAVARRCS